MVSILLDRLSFNVFSERIKTVSNSRFPHFIIGIAISDHVNFSIQAQGLDQFYLSSIRRKDIVTVEINHIVLLIKHHVVGINVFRLDAILGYHRYNELLKAIGNDKGV